MINGFGFLGLLASCGLVVQNLVVFGLLRSALWFGWV